MGTLGFLLINYSISYRNPPVWGTIKYLLEKFPKDASSKVKEKQDPYSHER